MPGRVIQVTAPSRLHFGMFSFGQAGQRQFGGVGAMIDAPGLRLRVTRADRFAAVGPLAARAAEFARRFAMSTQSSGLPPCRLEIVQAPPEHVGLGVGTQLGLSVAAALNAFLERPAADAVQLARLVGRGERSAIGAHGFAQGGMLVEAGKAPGETLSPLIGRVALPPAWRFVLVAPAGEAGLSGEAERRAFDELPPVDRAVTAELCREALLHLLPAAVEGRFDEFSESLYRYGHAAGLCFTASQAGAFASPRVAELAETIRQLGVAGVGQSSWGPTLFALLPDEASAAAFMEKLKRRTEGQRLQISLARPNDGGARVESLRKEEASR